MPLLELDELAFEDEDEDEEDELAPEDVPEALDEELDAPPAPLVDSTLAAGKRHDARAPNAKSASPSDVERSIRTRE